MVSTIVVTFTLLPSALITRAVFAIVPGHCFPRNGGSLFDRSCITSTDDSRLRYLPQLPGPVSMDCCPGDDQLPASFLSSGSIDSFLSREFVELRFHHLRPLTLPPSTSPVVASRGGMRQSINLRNDERPARAASTFIASFYVAPGLFRTLGTAICYISGCRSSPAEMGEGEMVWWNIYFFLLFWEREREREREQIVNF